MGGIGSGLHSRIARSTKMQKQTHLVIDEERRFSSDEMKEQSHCEWRGRAGE
jgi:hypothetical protein